MIVLVIQIPVHRIPAIVDQLINAPKRKLVVGANAKVCNIIFQKISSKDMIFYIVLNTHPSTNAIL